MRFNPLFASMNATANGAVVDRNPSPALESEDQQAEVLIPGFIGVRWIQFPTYPVGDGA
jgi:hypothetical protein